MKCKHVQELLPLYVGCDLEEKRAELVTAHVQSCAACASSADQYRETRVLLQQFAPPLFSDAVYAGIRQRVLREIGRESEQTLPQLLASLFRPRLRWAFATALLLAVCAFAFYFHLNRRNERRQVANNPAPVDRTNQNERRSARSEDHKSTETSLPARDKSDGMTTRARRVRKTGVELVFAESANRKRIADPETVPAREPASSQKTLRMEIQTKDRNIRIIWFSPQPPKQGSSIESSKGT